MVLPSVLGLFRVGGDGGGWGRSKLSRWVSSCFFFMFPVSEFYMI